MPEEYPRWVADHWERGGKRLNVHNPYNGEVVGTTTLADPDLVEQAIVSTVAARGPMAELSSFDRSRALSTVRRLMEEHHDELARLLSQEAGKPLKLAALETDRAIGTIQTAAEEATRLEGQVLALDITATSRGHFGIVRRLPVGPILGISPFNFPLNLAMHKVAAVLAAGNPILLKPTPRAPLTWLFMARLFAEADLPSGALNVLVCSNEMAGGMVEDERFKLVSFTGSAAVGWGLKARAGKKRVVLELGGNAAAIVDETAEPLTAAKKLAASAFGYSGQMCISTQRLFVSPTVREELSSALVASAEALRVGDPMDPETDVGPLIDEAAVQRTNKWVKEAVGMGARVLTGGTSKGTLFYPTVLADAPPQASICSEEAFAPVVTLAGYQSFEAAVDQVNDSVYGLQAGLFSQNLEHVLYAYQHLEVGAVIVNEAPSYRQDSMPYGGVKDSGQGREGLRYTMEEMTEPRLLVMGGSS